jgi:branched-chain amino acid transport system ATP-binding protein
MIEIDGVTVEFGGVRPLDNLSARLTAPVNGLIGPNGAGKTTLLNVISGFVTPVSGEVRLMGMPLTGLPPVRRMRLGLRRTFQQELVVEDLTAWDNVLAIADHASIDAATARLEVARAIEFAGLAAIGNVPGRRLNLFQRRMVELAKTLIGGSKVILLDEPGAGLNDRETGELRTRLKAIPAQFGAQVVLIDHDADLIAAVCEETMVIDFGRRLALGPTRSVLDDPEVRRAYLGTA